MRKIKIGTKKYQVKSSFDECTTDEISHILVSQNYMASVKGDTKQVVKLKIGIFLKLSKVAIDVFSKLTIPQQIALFQTIRWAFTAKIERKPFAFFEIEDQKYYLPDDGYENTSAIEMALLNIYYLSFVQKVNPATQMIYLIAATICRPERKDLDSFRENIDRWTGDVREVFNSVLAEERSKVFREKAPFGVMIAVFQYWEAMNTRFVTRFDDIFNGGDGRALFQNGEGWIAMLEDIAEMGVLGNLEKVYETNAHSAMLFVLHKQKKLERLQEIRAKQTE